MSDPKPSVHPDLARHQGSMTPQVFSLAGNVHCAFAYSVVNCTLIEGEDACILVDTMTSVDTAEAAAQAFRGITDKPIKTIIYTHFHADHVSGATAFVSEEDIAAGRVEIIAQEELTDHLARDVGLIAPILGTRAVYQFGMRLPVGEEGTMGAGLGPPQRPGVRRFAPPTKTFGDFYEGETGGIRFEVHLIPSETEDQCAVWLPDQKVLMSADAVYESFPNVYALRGTRFRNPLIWANGVDRLKSFGADILVPHHGRPVEGADKIAALLTDYRDAVQFLHDQTLRYMNKGYGPDEIKEAVTMPDHLKDHPWLGEYYGSYKHAIPAIYAGYLGWYQGDPVTLDPTPWREKAARYVAALGGREKLLADAEAALDAGDAQWAAELVTWAVRADTGDQAARSLKAKALRTWGYGQKNATWRNWALTAAQELEGALGGNAMVLGSPDQVRGYSLATIMNVMTVRLIPEKSGEMHLRVTFRTTDTDEACTLEIRRGVCQFHESPATERDAEAAFDRSFLLDWIFGKVEFADAVAAGGVAITGEADDVIGFLAAFEPFNTAVPISVSVR